MQVRGTHQTIEYTLDNIISKGGDVLYDKYITHKLPDHIHAGTNDLILRTFNPAFTHLPNKSSIAREVKPRRAEVDVYTPQKVIHSRPNSQLEIHAFTPLKRTTNKMNKSLMERTNATSNNTNNKPNSCIKNECYKVSDLEYEEEKKMRKEKDEVVREEKKKEAEENRIESQRSYRRKQLQSKIQQLAVLGIPYGYDDEGQIITPDLASFKSPKKQKEKERRSNIFELKFRTLDVGTARYNPEEVHNVTGKKRGFTSGKFYKKLRMTDEEYNNQNNRQFSTIPYATISDGVKITEKEKNIVASKTKEPPMNRDQFVKQTQKNFFKSFLPDPDGVALSMGTISERPNTTGHLNRTKGFAETRTTNSMRKSILWRPHTTSKTCRLNINNRELAKQFVNS